MWTPDEELVRTTRDILRDEAKELSSGASAPANDVTYLEALGTLVVLGVASGEDLAPGAAVLEPLRSRLAQWELPELDDAAVDVAEQAPQCLVLDELSWDEALRPLLQGLAARDRVELAWLGARALGLEGGIGDEAVSSRLSFDDMLQEALWQLLPLNGRRRAEVAWMAPAQRVHFPWWSLGAELPETALVEAAHQDEVLRLFPAAQRHVEALRRRQRPKAKVVSLVDRLKLKRQAQGLLWAAAVGTPSLPLAGNRFVELAFHLGRLQLEVDVLAPLQAGKVPELLLGEGRRVLKPGPEQGLRRFVFELGGVDEETAVLRLPLAQGVEEVPVG